MSVFPLPFLGAAHPKRYALRDKSKKHILLYAAKRLKSWSQGHLRQANEAYACPTLPQFMHKLGFLVKCLVFCESEGWTLSLMLPSLNMPVCYENMLTQLVMEKLDGTKLSPLMPLSLMYQRSLRPLIVYSARRTQALCSPPEWNKEAWILTASHRQAARSSLSE